MPPERPAGALQIYLLRHAETNKNVHSPETFQGDPEALTHGGAGQARVAGRFLRDRDISAVFTSPRPGARRTAEIVADTLGFRGAVVEKDAFRPLAEGGTPGGMGDAWAWREERWASGKDPRPPGGESLGDGMVRAGEAVGELAGAYPGRSIVIVPHSDICAALIGKAEQTPVSECYREHKVPLGSISRILVSGKGWLLESEGEVPPDRTTG